MARIGILKPLQGTASSLANIVLEEGEIAFDRLPSGSYGDYGIKMGDGVTAYSNLPYFIKRTKEDSWKYDEGNDENALLNNIQRPEQETIGKIYYIQSYMNAGTKHTAGTPTIQQGIPYKVIGINHEGTINTVDLQAMVAVNYIVWESTYYEYWYGGKYSTSGLYNWVGSTCQNGYSSNIQAKMCNMTERWREASGNDTGTLQTRSTKCKLLNPVELYGTSAASIRDTWQYASTSDHKTKFLSDNYGSHYSSIFPDSISADASRVLYHDKAMSETCFKWTNSWYAFYLSGPYCYCFYVNPNGSSSYNLINYAWGVAPVIRLSDNPE
jgi:hypothetical protein